MGDLHTVNVYIPWYSVNVNPFPHSTWLGVMNVGSIPSPKTQALGELKLPHQAGNSIFMHFSWKDGSEEREEVWEPE